MSNDLPTLVQRIDAAAAVLRPELIQIRRQIHANPELARQEVATSTLVAARLRQAGLQVQPLAGTGLVCDIAPTFPASQPRRVILRADLDALPVRETSGLPFAASNGHAHACGHDVHSTVVLGAGLVLAQLAAAGQLAAQVRLLFQPAEEVQPGGAQDVLAARGLADYQEIYTLHCDPKLDVGYIGSRIGPITSASDAVTVTVSGPGGHTSRPHNSADVVFALGQVITQVPSILGRRLDPRSGVNLTWGAVHAGTATNAIPSVGSVTGTMRCLDANAWEQAEGILEQVVEQVVAPYQVGVSLDLVRGVPPVVNDEACVHRFDAAARAVLGDDAVVLTEQSLGGEDFGWYLGSQESGHDPSLEPIRGAMVRLGTRTPGGPTYDLHQPDLVIDEQAIDHGVRVLAA
ncbi:MAG: amidohydrolase, partial [Beutenbergiaceae bacterium]